MIIVCQYNSPISCQTDSFWEKLIISIYSLWVSNDTDKKCHRLFFLLFLVPFCEQIIYLQYTNTATIHSYDSA